MQSEANRRKNAESGVDYSQLTPEKLKEQEFCKELLLLAQKHLERSLQEMEQAVKTGGSSQKDQNRLIKGVYIYIYISHTHTHTNALSSYICICSSSQS